MGDQGSISREDPLEKGKATQLQYSGLENSMDCIVRGVAESDMTKVTEHAYAYDFEKLK